MANVILPNNNTSLYNATGNAISPNNNISANNISASGNVTVDGFIFAQGSITTASNFVGNLIGNVTGNVILGGGNTEVIYNNDGVTGSSPAFTFDDGTNVLSVTGNVDATYFLGNGALLTGITTNYSNANVEALLPVYTGNIGAGNISATGNITGSYIIGNGSQLTGLPAGYSNANVAAYLPTYSGNISAGNVSVTSNVTAAILRTSGVTGNIVGANYINANFYIGDGGLLSNIQANVNYSNANVAAYLPTYSGNITAGNVSATGNIQGSFIIGNGSQLTGLPAGYSNANVAAYLPTYSGNIAAGNVSATGNITGNYLFGNGSQLTGLPESYGNANVAAYLPTYTGNVQAGNVTTVGPQGNITGANLVSANTYIGSGGNLDMTNMTSHAIPATNAAYTLGNTTNRWAQAWISGTVTGGLFVGDGSGLSNVGAGTYGNANVVSLLANYGNNVIITNSTISAANFVGDGSQLTNLPVQPGTYGNANVADYLPTDSTITGIQGNITTLQGQVYSNANVASYLPTYSGALTANTVTATLIGDGGNISNITGANVTGTVSQANVVTNASQPNITSLGTLTGLTTGTLDVTGQLTANANAQFNGDVYFTGNVTLPGNINQISGNSASFFGNAVTGFGALYAGLPAGYTLLNQEITQFSASFNGYTQVSLRNISGGDQATGDFVVTADNGTDTTNFVNLGFTNSTYNGLLANNSLGNSVFANDGYLYAQGNGTSGGNIVIGSNQTNGVIRFIANGVSSLSGVVATVSANGIAVNGNVSANYLIGDASQVTNVPVAAPVIGSVTSSATITPTGTSTQYNVTALAVPATIAAPTGSPVDGQKLTIRILDNGTPQALTWNAIYRAVGIVLPTVTTAGKVVYAGCIYNSQATRWDVVSLSQEV